MRAALLHDSQTYRSLGVKLNGGKKGWNYDEAAVVQAVCELAMHQFFGSRHHAQVITVFVSEIRAKIARSMAPPDQDDMEMVICAALGEVSDAELVDIKRSELFRIRGLVVNAASDILAFDCKAIDNLVVNAEKIAVERGWSPPLAR